MDSMAMASLFNGTYLTQHSLSNSHHIYASFINVNFHRSINLLYQTAESGTITVFFTSDNSHHIHINSQNFIKAALAIRGPKLVTVNFFPMAQSKKWFFATNLGKISSFCFEVALFWNSGPKEEGLGLLYIRVCIGLCCWSGWNLDTIFRKTWDNLEWVLSWL